MNQIATTRNLTALGVVAIIQALAVAAQAVFDGDPSTTVDFAALVSSIIGGVTAIMAKGAGTTGAQSIGGKPITPAPAP